jgi:hypothetical protein
MEMWITFVIFKLKKLDNYKFLCKIYQGNSERLYSLTSYFCRFVMSHEILFLVSNLFLFFNSQVKSHFFVAV